MVESRFLWKAFTILSTFSEPFVFTVLNISPRVRCKKFGLPKGFNYTTAEPKLTFSSKRCSFLRDSTLQKTKSADITANRKGVSLNIVLASATREPIYSRSLFIDRCYFLCIQNFSSTTQKEIPLAKPSTWQNLFLWQTKFTFLTANCKRLANVLLSNGGCSLLL